MNNLLKVLSLFAAVIFVFSGCAKHVSKCQSPEDNPKHHYSMGMDLLEENRLDDASAKFERALYCESDYAPAQAGMAIVTAMKAAAPKPEGYRKVDTDKAYEYLNSAYKDSQTKEDEFAYRVAYMRVYTVLKPKKWLGSVEDAFKSAMKLKVDEKQLIYYNGRESATYYMGAAYLEAREFQKARDRFSDVLSARTDSKWNALAEKGWKQTDKIVRALAGITLGDVGKEIAVKSAVKRADVAALFVDELKVEKLFAGRIPVKSEVEKLKAEFVPADVVNSPFKQDVEILMKWKIRGLEPVYDETTKAYLFRPDEPVTRKELALALEDVLIKITGDEKTAKAFFGHDKSPFPDVPPTSAWYNAIMNVTTRNIMETELSGEFRPNDNVDGAEAVLAVRVLRQRLNIN